jgi:Cys-tRNA(Pro) deacylase
VKPPETNATRHLRRIGISYSEHLYVYEVHGGTAVSARELGVDEHLVVKTLVFEDDTKRALIVLMHGDRKVSTKNLARQLEVKGVSPCAAEVAQRHTGYQFGGTSPFGTRKAIPVCAEKTVLALPRLYINGGKRGFLVGIRGADLQHLQPTPVEVAIE